MTTSSASDAADRVAINVTGLGVQYSLKFTRKTTLRQSLTRRVSIDGGDSKFWALRDVTFRVNQGESLGVIGPNGAGKSTLLQVLAGIITPSAGVVEVDGHVSSLLSLGAGFDSDLSGVENIRLAGAFMGLDHADVETRLPGMVEYADLGQFIDAPIRTYSAGMKARLGFAIATSVDPDILLLDEVLATGDAAFREKSKARVLELVKEAKAIVLVTHDMTWVSEYCNKAMLIEQGRVIAEGEPDEVVEIHREHSEQRRAEKIAAGVLPVPPSGPPPGGAVAAGAPPVATPTDGAPLAEPAAAEPAATTPTPGVPGPPAAGAVSG
jgi:ABC-type polysaccharide/polyol phosphate transport system ATPase subunit